MGRFAALSLAALAGGLVTGAAVAGLSSLSSGCARVDAPALPSGVAPAVARVVTAEDTLGGPCAGGVPGDLLLENAELRAIVSRTERASGFANGPGNLVDLTWRAGGEDHLNEVFLYLEEDFPRQARYADVAILSDGGGAAAAVVRARGTDSKDPRITIDTEYRLEPGARWVTLTSRFTATEPVRGYRIGDAVMWGRARALAPGHGFDLPGRRLPLDWVAGVGESSSYAFVPDGPRSLDTASGTMWSDPIGAVVDLAPDAPYTYVRHMVVGRGDTASLADAVATLRRDATGVLAGAVTDAGAPVTDGVVEVFDAAGALGGLARTDTRGRYEIRLRPGRYRATASAPGRRPVSSGPVDLTSGAPLDLPFALGPRAALTYRITDEGGPRPVKLTIVGLDGTPTPDLGPTFSARGAAQYALSLTGAGELALEPGRYRVLASAGPERELVDAVVTLAPGARVAITGELRRAFSTPGLISADLHQHAAPSFDSGVSLPDRALANAAEGVEVLVSTDHNILTDFAPTIRALHLEDHLTSVIGVEATTHTVGHFNALPVVPRPGALRGGMVDPEGLAPRQIFDLLRGLGAKATPAFLQVNHPRAGPRTGYFDALGLDPSTATTKDPRFSTDFDGMEVVSFGGPKETVQALRDYFALLARGHRITATGNSDSHTVSLREVGWPRTYACVTNDDPRHLDERELAASLRSGCATVSAGPVVVLSSGATKMGGVLPAKGGRFAVDVEVDAASWVPTDELVLLVDGRPAKTVRLEGTAPLRHRGRHALECRADCAVLAMVTSATPLGPVLSREEGRVPLPVGLTNPIYVDADGDGRYAPPSAKKDTP